MLSLKTSTWDLEEIIKYTKIILLNKTLFSYGITLFVPQDKK